MSSTLLLYKEIVALNREQHAGLRLKEVKDAGFAAGINLTPLAGLEFFQAARHYPVLFVGEEKKLAPIALLGLRNGENAFVEPTGLWRSNVYVPAFVRRYPFVLAEDDSERFTVCFDSAFEGWSQEEGRALFEADGSNSAFLEEMLTFMQNFTAEMTRTRRFTETLIELDLLVPRNLQLRHGSGAQFNLNDFSMVDEEKFLALSDEQVLSLHRQGFLPWIYAHLMSLGNVNDLYERYLASAAQAESLEAEPA